jgi:hypothetical protein
MKLRSRGWKAGKAHCGGRGATELLRPRHQREAPQVDLGAPQGAGWAGYDCLQADRLRTKNLRYFTRLPPFYFVPPHP